MEIFVFFKYSKIFQILKNNSNPTVYELFSDGQFMSVDSTPCYLNQFCSDWAEIFTVYVKPYENNNLEKSKKQTFHKNFVFAILH